MKKILLLIMIAGFFTLASCKKDSNEPIVETPESTDQLVVPSTFDWKTTHEVEFSLQGFANSIVEITSEEGDVFLKLALQKDQLTHANLALPAYQNEVVLKYLGQSVKVDVTGGAISHSFTISTK